MSEDPEAGTMTFWEHLEELRQRLVRMALAFAVGAGLSWYYREKLLSWLTAPFVDAWNHGSLSGKAALHFLAPADLFVAYLKLSALCGFVLALPFMLWQVWAFIAPGLYRHEKRLAFPFVVSSMALFALGGWFGYRVAFPAAFQFLLGLGGQLTGSVDVTPTVTMGEYISFVTQMFIAFGVTFELPVLVFFLSIAGLVDHKKLIAFFRYFIVVAFLVAAVLTPPDVTSQFLLAIPLIGLYIVSIGVAYVFAKKPAPSDGAT